MLMIYAPRNHGELATIKVIINRAYDWALRVDPPNAT